MAQGSGVGGRVVRTAGVPYYLQVANIIRDELRAGRWEAGALIPSEAALCEMFGVSRTAIRQALGELVLEGLLRKEKGRGTFVSRPQVTLAVQELRGFHDEVADRGGVVGTDIRCQEVVVVPPAAAPELDLPMGAEVVCLERVRTVGGEPIVYVTTYLPAGRFRPLIGMDLRRASLYAVLDSAFGVQPRGGRRRIEAVPAEARQARLLGVRARSPMLRVTATNVDADGVPFEHFDAWYRADRTSFEIVVSPDTAHAQLAASESG